MVHTTPPVVHIVGRKGSGKTELISGIIRLLTSKGYRVAGVRHSPHNHSIDSSGTDTRRFEEAGAQGTALISAHRADLFFAAQEWQQKKSLLTHTFQDCHLILIEGGIQNGKEKIEVVSPGESPLCKGDVYLRALVSKGSGTESLPCFSPDDVTGIGSFIEDNYLKPVLSAAVLAGGKSSRLGRNKALLRLNSTTVIERVVASVSRFVTQTNIITNSPDEYKHLGLETAQDIRPGCGPLSGIHTALSISPTEYVLVVSCDVPLVAPADIQPLIKEYPGNDIVIYKHIRFEPLCAVYRRTCIAALDELIDHGEYRIIDLFPMLKVHVVRIQDGSMFRSINTQEDYDDILKKV